MLNYKNYYGKSVAIIGRANKGDELNPFLIENITQALEIFEGGELIDAYKEVNDCGAEFINLVRVDYNNEHDFYHKLEEVYEVIENIGETDIILPLGIYLDSYIINYPDFFRMVQDFKYNHLDKNYGNIFKVDRPIESVNSIKINNKKTENYTVSEGEEKYPNLITINEGLIEGDVIEVDYNAINEINLELEILAFVDNRIADSKTLYTTYDTSKVLENLTDTNVADYFNYKDDEGVRYIARCNKEFIKVMISPETGRVLGQFDYDKYILKNTKKEYFALQLAKACSRIHAVGILEPSSYEYNKLFEIQYELKALLNNNINYGRYIVSTPSICNYSNGLNQYSSSYKTALTGLLGFLPSNISLTNKSSLNVKGITNNYSYSQIRDLSSIGYTTLYNSVRNGIVPYKAHTFAHSDSPYRNLKNMRIVNEISTRIKEITDSFIGKGSRDIESKLEKLINQLSNTLINEEKKVRDFSFEIEELKPDYIKINLSLVLYNELNNINAGVISKT